MDHHVKNALPAAAAEPVSPNELTATFEIRSSSYGSYASSESRQPIYHSNATDSLIIHRRGYASPSLLLLLLWLLLLLLLLLSQISDR